MPPDTCRGAGARFCWRLWVPPACVLLGDISALPVALPAQFTCPLSLCSFSGTQSTGLNQGMPQLLERVYLFLEKTSQNGETVGKRGQRLQEDPPLPHPPRRNADLLSGFKWELLFCETELTTYR